MTVTFSTTGSYGDGNGSYGDGKGYFSYETEEPRITRELIELELERLAWEAERGPRRLREVTL